MSQKLAIALLVATIAAWAGPSFAQRQTANGNGIIALSAGGSISGVDMQASGTTGTLTVGTIGGVVMDVFSSNTTLISPLQAISTQNNSQGNVQFNSGSTVFGAIGVTQPGGPFLRNISAGNASTTVNFLGPVFATIFTINQTGTANFNSGSTNVVAMNFAGDGTLNLAPNTSVIGALTTNAASTGTLGLGSGSTLDGAVGGANGLRAINVTGGTNSAGVSANITGAANAVMVSLGTNTLFIGGSLTLANGAPTGVINTTIASPTVFGNIRVLGATFLGAGLTVNVAVPAATFIAAGTQFNIIQTQTGTVQSGTNGTIVTVTSSNPLYTFAAVPLLGTVDGLVAIRTVAVPIQVPLIMPSAGLPPTLPIAVVVVPALLGATLTPDLTVVLAALNALTDPVAVVNALVQLAPADAGLVGPLITFQATRQFQNLWLSRLDDVMCRQATRETAKCTANGAEGGWWLKSFGRFANQDARNAFTGYDATTLGTMIAYDAPIGADTRAGFGAGYARSMIDGRVGTAATDIMNYRALAYITHERGPWYVNASASFGWNDYSGRRSIEFPGISRRASATYSGQDYTGFVTTGFRVVAGSFTLTPIASLQYTRVVVNGYAESGAGDVSLRVNSQGYGFLESGLGMQLARPFVIEDGTYIVQMHANWFHMLRNPTMTNTAAFPTSPSFTPPGFRSAADTFNVGAGVTFLSCGCGAKTWSLEAVYDFDWRTDGYRAHQGTVKFTSRF